LVIGEGFVVADPAPPPDAPLLDVGDEFVAGVEASSSELWRPITPAPHPVSNATRVMGRTLGNLLLLCDSLRAARFMPRQICKILFRKKLTSTTQGASECFKTIVA
jgi:hypothetical protein